MAIDSIYKNRRASVRVGLSAYDDSEFGIRIVNKNEKTDSSNERVQTNQSSVEALSWFGWLVKPKKKVEAVKERQAGMRMRIVKPKEKAVFLVLYLLLLSLALFSVGVNHQTLKMQFGLTEIKRSEGEDIAEKKERLERLVGRLKTPMVIKQKALELDMQEPTPSQVVKLQ